MKAIHEPAFSRRFAEANKGGDPAAISRIEKFLREAGDVEIADINPNRFANAQGLDPMTTVRTFLRLTKEGVFDLNWAVHCPHRKGRTQTSASLEKLCHQSHCELCSSDFDAGFDRNVELSFAPNPNVITLSDLDPFAIGLASLDLEPGISLLVEEGQRGSIEIDLRPGNFVIISKDGLSLLNLVISSEKSTASQSVGFRFNASRPGVKSAVVKSGRTKLVIENNAAEEREFILARLRQPGWMDAALVSTLQDFRDFFSKEMISPTRISRSGTFASFSRTSRARRRCTRGSATPWSSTSSRSTSRSWRRSCGATTGPS